MINKIEHKIYLLFLAILPRGIRARVELNPSSHRIFSSILHLFSEKGIRLFVGIVTYALVVQYLGPSDYGKYSLVLNITALMVPFIHYGLDEILSRDFIRSENNPEKIGEIVGTSSILKLINSFFALGLLVLYLSLNGYSGEIRTLCLVYGFFLALKSLDSFDIYFQSRLDVRRLTFSRNLGYFSQACSKIGGVLSKVGLLFFILAHCAELFISKASMIIFYRKRLKSLKFHFSLKYALNLWHEAFPMFLVIFGMVATDRLVPIFINEQFGSVGVGEYGAAMGLVDIWVFFPAVVSATFFPDIVRAHSSDNKLFLLKIQNLANLLIWLALIICICGTLFGPGLLPKLFGAAYRNSSETFVWLIWAQLFTYYNWVKFKWFSIENKLNELMLGYVLAISIQLLSLPWLLSLYGLKGGGISIAVGFSLSYFLMAIFFKLSRLSLLVFFRSFLFPFSLLRERSL